MKANLENDLLKTDWISYKCTINNVYAQNLYAALCNNIFIKDKDEWTTSWRGSGGIVSSLIKDDTRYDLYSHRTGDYLDWYCSGIYDPVHDWGMSEEGIITPEIEQDIDRIGWLIIR